MVNSKRNEDLGPFQSPFELQVIRSTSMALSQHRVPSPPVDASSWIVDRAKVRQLCKAPGFGKRVNIF